MTTFDREQAIHSIASYIHGPQGVDADYDYLNTLSETLRGYSDGMLSRLDNGMYSDSSDLDLVDQLISDGEKEAGISEALFFLKTVQTRQLSFVLNAVQGLHITSQLPEYADYSTADEMTIRQCIALVSVTVALMDSQGTELATSHLVHKPMQPRFATAVGDEGLVQLVMDHPDDHERIVRVIYERNTASVSVIAEVLNAAAPSLSDGSL